MYVGATRVSILPRPAARRTGAAFAIVEMNDNHYYTLFQRAYGHYDIIARAALLFALLVKSMT